MGKRIDNTSCHCLKIRRSAENVIHFYDTILAPLKITVRQFSLLDSIRHHDQCSIRELADDTELEKSTLARSLKPLMKMGYIIDAKEPGARNSRLTLSKQGKKLCQEASNLWQQAQERYEEKIGKDSLKQLEMLLEKLQHL